MNINESRRLFAYWNAKRNRPHGPSTKAKRHVKGHAKAYGQILKSSHIKYNVHVEKLFLPFK